MKILMLLYNTVDRDSRVLREAAALATAGHEVRVLGIGDSKHLGQKVMPAGFTIVWGQRPGQNDRDLPAQDVPRRIIAGLVRAAKAVHRPKGLALTALLTVAVIASLIFLVPREAHLATFSWIIGTLVVLGVAGLAFTRTAAWRRLRPELGPAFHLFLDALFENRPRKLTFTRNLGDFQPDVVHCHDVEPLPAAIEIVKRTGALFTWDAHELYDEFPGMQRVVQNDRRRLIRRVAPLLDGFVTINDSIARDYAERFPKLPPAVIVKNAANFDPKATLPVDDGRLHKAAGVPKDRKIILYQGGFTLHRGLEALVRNATAIPQGWSLVLMGWGGLEAPLAESAAAVNASTGDAHRVTIIPPAPQAELAQWSAGATLGVIMYDNTGKNHLYCTPNKLWEFPAAGVPIICNDLVELAGSVRANNIGWVLSDENDPAALSQLIGSLTAKDIEKTRANCLTYMRGDNWSVYSQRLVDYYAGITRR